MYLFFSILNHHFVMISDLTCLFSVGRNTSRLISDGVSVSLIEITELHYNLTATWMSDDLNTGLAMAVWISGGISGGHVNPAVRFDLSL